MERFHTNPGELKWHKLQSWEWPKHHMNLVEVFMLQNWDQADINPNDLSVQLNVWKKCSGFPAGLLPFADQLRKSRNMLAHRSKIKNKDKQHVFKNIKQVLQHQDVNHLIDAINIQILLADLENGHLFKYQDDIHQLLNSADQFRNTLQNIEKNLNAVQEGQRKTFSFRIVSLY